MTDVQALVETVRYALLLVPSRRTQNPLGPWSNDPNVDTALAALDELVLVLTRQEAVVEAAAALDDEYTMDGEAGYSYHEALHVALAALSSPPVASGERP